MAAYTDLVLSEWLLCLQSVWGGGVYYHRTAAHWHLLDRVAKNVWTALENTAGIPLLFGRGSKAVNIDKPTHTRVGDVNSSVYRKYRYV